MGIAQFPFAAHCQIGVQGNRATRDGHDVVAPASKPGITTASGNLYCCRKWTGSDEDEIVAASYVDGLAGIASRARAEADGKSREDQATHRKTPGLRQGTITSEVEDQCA